MNTPSANTDRALALFEVLVVVAVLLLLAALFLPALVKSKSRSSKISCVNCLKQVGLGFRIWAGDNSDKFPMQVSVTNGGTMELIATATVFRHFQAMSNELNTSKILLCPMDTERINARTNAGNFGAGFDDQSVSYFVGVDAVEQNPGMLLGGDRNMTVKNITLRRGLHSVATNELTGWNEKIHNKQGNILLADGSVQGAGSAGLTVWFHESGVPTNRLAFP